MCAEHGQSGSEQGSRRETCELRFDLDRFTHEALEREAAQLGVTAHELARFAVLYYLADHDSGRIARRLLPIAPPAERHPLGELLDG